MAEINFSHYMNNIITADNNTDKSDKNLAVAVSGGADSMALTLMINQWANHQMVDTQSVDTKLVNTKLVNTKLVNTKLVNKSAEQMRYKISALTVDHKLRPDSSAEAQQITEWLNRYNIDHYILPWDHDHAITHDIQNQAREARYFLLWLWCINNNVSRVCLAHNLEDQVDTFFMRLAKASGVEGLGAMQPISQYYPPAHLLRSTQHKHGGAITILRPLLQVSHEDLTQWLREQNQPWIEDPSNRLEKYQRTRLRRIHRPLAEHGIELGKIYGSIKKIHQWQKYLHKDRDQWLNSHLVVDPRGWCEIKWDEFTSSSNFMKYYALRYLIHKIGNLDYPPTLNEEEFAAIMKRFSEHKNNLVTLGNTRVWRNQEKLYLSYEARRSQPAIAVPWPIDDPTDSLTAFDHPEQLVHLHPLWHIKLKQTKPHLNLHPDSRNKSAPELSLEFKFLGKHANKLLLDKHNRQLLSSIPRGALNSLPAIFYQNQLYSLPSLLMWYDNKGQLLDSPAENSYNIPRDNVWDNIECYYFMPSIVNTPYI